MDFGTLENLRKRAEEAERIIEENKKTQDAFYDALKKSKKSLEWLLPELRKESSIFDNFSLDRVEATHDGGYDIFISHRRACGSGRMTFCCGKLKLSLGVMAVVPAERRLGGNMVPFWQLEDFVNSIDITYLQKVFEKVYTRNKEKLKIVFGELV